MEPEHEFPLRDGLIYLNHAGVSPLPRRAADRLNAFLGEYISAGATFYPHWLKQEAKLRERLKTLINAASVDRIALQKSTSEALSTIAYGFPWRAGDNVVIAAEEFISNRIVWESLAGSDVTTRQVDLTGAAEPEAALIEACDARTRLLSVSSVQYASGLRMDLKTLGEACRERGIAFCVDAIQGLGVMPHDVQDMHIDFLVADGHKWLLGPEGLAVFYCDEAWLQQLKLNEFGWHMVEDAGNYERRDWAPASTATRFECGSPNMLGIYALSASVELLLETGIEEVDRRVTERSGRLIELLDARDDLDCISVREPGRYAGIVTFAPQESDPDSVYRQLKRAGVICACRGRGVRFSPHFYTPMSSLEQAVELIPRG